MNLSLIETMRFEPGQGIIRFRLHMARLGNSARKLGIPGFDTAESALHKKLETLSGPSRVRLELFSDGHAEITSAMYLPMPDDTVWTVLIANSVELKSSEPLLRHKTSARAIYDTARAEYPREQCDEVVLLNDKGDVSEGTITNVFVEADDGKLVTPPLSSGCLAGVFRTSLLCRKKARVGRVLPADLEQQPLYLGNSLRGLIRARLITDR